MYKTRTVHYAHLRQMHDDSADAFLNVWIQRIIYPSHRGCSPPKTFWQPPTPSSNGGVKSSYTYPDKGNAILSYRMLLQYSLNYS